MHAQSLNCVLLCDPVDYSPPRPSVHRILQARILEWVAGPSSKESSPSSDQIHVSCIAAAAAKSLLHCRQILYPLSHL